VSKVGGRLWSWTRIYQLKRDTISHWGCTLCGGGLCRGKTRRRKREEKGEVKIDSSGISRLCATIGFSLKKKPLYNLVYEADRGGIKKEIVVQVLVRKF